MDREEIERYLAAAAGHSIMVDVRELPGLPGLVRTVLIHRDGRVTIEHDRVKAYVERHDEWPVGPKYIGEYGSLDEVLADLEDYLGMPVAGWRNFTREPLEPEDVDDPRWAESVERITEMVRTRTLPIPGRGAYRVASTYWEHIERFGEYRPWVERAEERARWAEDGDDEAAPPVFKVAHVRGGDEPDPPLDQLPALYDELSDADAPRDDVSVTHEASGWRLRAYRDGRVTFGLREDWESLRHLPVVAKETVVALWRRLAVGEIQVVLASPWRPGPR